MKHYLFTRIRAFSIIFITLFSTSYLSAQADCGCMGGPTPATAVVLTPDSNCMTQIDSTDLDDLTSCTGPYVFTIINNDGADAVSGTFNGLAEGGTITFNTVTLYITYTGGDGNDVVLQLTDPLPVELMSFNAKVERRKHFIYLY